MNAARLNVFQRLVRQWDTVHPYNAAQILRIAGVANAAALKRAWQQALSALGLGPAHVIDRRYHYEPVNGDAERYGVENVPPATDLQTYISAEMNRAFGPGDLPLRPFLLQQDGSYYLGVVYAHWIADSASIRLLLREWFTRVYDPAMASGKPVRIGTGGYWSIFGPHRSRWRLGEQILTLIRSANQFRKVRQLRTQGSSDFAMKYLLHRGSAGLIDRLIPVARQMGVTLNDVFLSAMADVCERYTPVREARRRTDLAVGMIVDLRPRTRRDLSDVFSLFLGFTNIICKRPDFENWPRLVKTIARQTRFHKATDVPQASSVWMFAALVAGRFVKREKSFRFYRKHMPLAGGISNVNLNRSWAGRFHPQPVLEYLRVSPTGPMVPLVFTTTTLGENLNLGLTYRSALFTDEVATEMARLFLEKLDEIASRPSVAAK